MAKKKKNKKNTPLELNQTLVAGAGRANYQTGGQSSLGVELRGDLMTKPIMDVILGNNLKEEEKKKTNKN